MDTFINAQQRAQFIRDGYITASGLIGEDILEVARQGIWDTLEANPNDPTTWNPEKKKDLWNDDCPRAMTICRTPELEAAARELAGPHCLEGQSFNPLLDLQGLDPLRRGVMPVLTFPEPKPRVPAFMPFGFHLDSMQMATLWPSTLYLVVLIYLSDTTKYGGATAVCPGSHRQIFEYWMERGDAPKGEQALLPDLPYQPAIPIPGKAGDVIFMHYLLRHAGSKNYADHIRLGLNTAIAPDPACPYVPREGSPQPDWTPIDYTLRTDDIRVAESVSA